MWCSLDGIKEKLLILRMEIISGTMYFVRKCFLLYITELGLFH